MEKVLADDAAQTAAIRAAVARYAAAWQAGDRAAIAACYHDEFTLHYAGHNPLAGTHRGKPPRLPLWPRSHAAPTGNFLASTN